MSLALRLIDEPAAEAIVAGRCPVGYACPPDFPAEEDRVAAGLFLERCAAGADPRPFGAYAVCLTGEDAGFTTDPGGRDLIVGGIGFHGAPDDAGRVEIGYGIVPSQRRKGHATQALRELVRLARTLGAVTLAAETEPGNRASQAVLKRSGFSRFAHDERTVWFELALG